MNIAIQSKTHIFAHCESMTDKRQIKNKTIKIMSYSELAKLELWDAVNCIHSQSDLDEFKNLIAKFFADKAQKAIDALWDNGSINEETIETWGKEHMRTTYKK